MSRTRRVLLALLTVGLLQRPVSFLAAAMLPDRAVNAVPQCIAGALLTLLLMALPAWLLRPWQCLRLARAKKLLPGLLLAMAAALLTRGALAPVDAAWQRALHLPTADIPLPDSLPLALLYVGTLAVIPAVAEESFFRGALLTGLMDGCRRITAVMIVSLSFAVMHPGGANLPSLLALSLVLTGLMLRTGRMAVPIAAHLIYNLTALIPVALPLWGSVVCACALLGLAARMLLRLPRYAQQKMTLPDGLIAAASAAVLAAAYIV